MPNIKKENPNKRVVPYNTEAEMYVLGSIIIDNNVMHAVSGKIVESDFYDPENQIIYRAILSLFNNDSVIDPLSIIDEMRRLKIEIAEGAKEYIITLVDNVPSTAAVNLYIDLVKEKAVERELLNNMKELSDDILVGSLDFNSLLDKAEDRIQNIIKKRRTSSLLTMDEAVQSAYEHIESYVSGKENLRGVSTGYSRLDKATLGFQKGDLIILAARPSVGKSAFALDLAINACRKNSDVHIAFFSLEMSIEQLMMRLFSYESTIPMSKLQKGSLDGKEMILLGHACKALKKHNLYFDESNSSDIYDIRSKCRQLKQQGRLDMVIIDYLQLITSSDGRKSRQEEVAKISRDLKVLAKELEVPLIALSQLSRNIETREDKKPVLSDLRESGSIEQDADIVMFLYRPETKKKKDEVYEAEIVTSDVEKDDNGEKVIELIIAKNRQGSLRDIMYNFTPEICSFQESKYSIQMVKKETLEEEK